MNQSKRNFIKALPLAALAAVSVKADGVDAKAYELRTGKKYLFVFPDASVGRLSQCAEVLRARGINAVVCNAEPTVYEVG